MLLLYSRARFENQFSLAWKCCGHHDIELRFSSYGTIELHVNFRKVLLFQEEKE
jgi:hypothetical protein